ncbi:MAG: nucleotidyltransferase family protein [Ignavibacteriae bacterium]|nr:nucleotidyltransferase family protein [Ignavibacteriota bacterium]
MKVEKDFVEFIELLNKHKVKYLVVGAYALAYYAEPRNTGDIDFFVKNNRYNAKKIIKVLKEFGFGELEISIDDFIKENNVIQLGFPPVRIDLLTSLSGLKFDEAYKIKNEVKLGNQKVFLLAKESLIKNKEVTGRKIEKN